MTASNKDNQINHMLLWTLLAVLWLVIHFWVRPEQWNTVQFADRLARPGSVEFTTPEGKTFEARPRFREEAPLGLDLIHGGFLLAASWWVGGIVIGLAAFWNYKLWLTPEVRRWI